MSISGRTGEAERNECGLEGVVGRRKHGWREEWRHFDFWPLARSATVSHQTVMLFRLAFPQLLILLHACTGQQKTGKINAPTPFSPCPPFFIWWWLLTGSEGCFLRLPLAINFLSWKTFLAPSGSKAPNPPFCCWETTPVICVLSECIMDSDMERQREREREWEKRERGGGVKE